MFLVIPRLIIDKKPEINLLKIYELTSMPFGKDSFIETRGRGRFLDLRLKPQKLITKKQDQ